MMDLETQQRIEHLEASVECLFNHIYEVQERILDNAQFQLEGVVNHMQGDFDQVCQKLVNEVDQLMAALSATWSARFLDTKEE